MRRTQRLVCIFVLLVSSLLAACDSSPTPSTPTPEAEVVAPATPTSVPSQPPSGEGTATTPPAPGSPAPSATSSPLLPGSPTSTPLPTVPTSLDKIEGAEKAGKLDRDTALLYTIYAFYDRDSLPEEYRGDDSGVEVEGMHALGELALRFDKLSLELKAKVEPFLERPSEPGSFWNRSQAGGRVGGLSAPAAQTLTSTTWLYVDSTDTQTRVWYPKTEEGEGYAGLADQLAREIDSSDMWNKEKRVMRDKYTPCSDAGLAKNGGNARLDVYLTLPDFPVPRDRAPGTPAALRSGFGGDFIVPQQNIGRSCPMAGFVLLNSALDFKALKSYMAHELFHAFQSAVTVKVLDPEWYWWAEASATWAMDLVYPQVNYEHEFILSGEWAQRRGLLGPLTCPGKPAPCNYGAYLWPFYMTRGGGGIVDDYIGTIWESSKERKPIEVMGDIPGMQEMWKQFALWNWNEGPADLYRDPDEQGSIGHIAPLEQYAYDLGSQGNRIMPKDRLWPGKQLELARTFSANVNLPPTAFDFYTTGKPPERAGVLHFEFGALTSRPGASVQAIITIGDPPTARYYQDWSALSEKKFCLDRPSEYATNVVVIVANSGLKSADTLQGDLKVTGKAETCPNRSSMSYSVGGSYAFHAKAEGVYGSANGFISTHEQVESTWSLEFDERHGDNIEYNFVATNRIDMHANARLSGQYGETVGRVSAQLSGSSTTHNPTQPGDDGYGIKTAATLGNQYNNLPQPKQPGHLTLTKINGKDAYIMTLGITPIIPQYSYQAQTTFPCDKGAYRHDLSFDNSSYTERHRESGDSKCFKYGGSFDQPEVGPFAFGAVQLDTRSPRGPVGSYNFIAGYYDPKSTVIEGSETFAAGTCDAALRLDPLVAFVGTASSRLLTTSKGFSDPAATTCNLYYTAYWRVDLPKQP